MDRSCGAVREYRLENRRTVMQRSEELEMDEKNYTEVLINGNVYTLGGAEDPEYLQKVAAYINEKIAVLKHSRDLRDRIRITRKS